MRAVIMAPRTLRMVAAIFAITAMLCVSAASVSASHAHLKEPIDRCDVCSAAHLTAQQIAVVQIVHAPELRSLVAPLVTARRIESRGVVVLLTRGPPSLSTI
jgi:TATA-box binding protein (TBP) (component of TFIID and TFIIIB)